MKKLLNKILPKTYYFYHVRVYKSNNNIYEISVGECSIDFFTPKSVITERIIAMFIKEGVSKVVVWRLNKL